MHARGSKIWILRPTGGWFGGSLSPSGGVKGGSFGCWGSPMGGPGCWLLLALVVASSWNGGVLAAHWTHHKELDANYSLFWTPADQHITFEVQVRTLGYVGFGFSVDGLMPGADMVVGWVRDNQVFFQDRYAEGREEPKVDPSQDYELLLGYENGTHTVLRFRRQLDTCDDHDIRISNDTMRMLWAYHSKDPIIGGSTGSLQYHGPLQRGSRSLYLLENPPSAPPAQDTHVWDVTNSKVTLSALEDTIYWCRIFRLPNNVKQKQHMIRYTPLVEQGNVPYLNHIILYECRGDIDGLEELMSEEGQACFQSGSPVSNCNTIVLAWNQGSEGFSFPPEAGYPLDPGSFYMLETHYNNPGLQRIDIVDSSGIRILYTKTLRQHDAGVISVGLDPNWRHIIPPGQPQVVSEGHCIADCTRQTLPPKGINIFGVVLHTHLIGRKIRLRQIRDGEELAPIAIDNHYDFNYQENRQLAKPAKVLPGDHLIAECVYDSEQRTTITLGGLTTREEKCLVYGMYYPRINLSLCHSLPSLPTVLHSLGIQELWPESSPVKIKLPPELSDMTLETRLVTYDWEHNFQSFQDATHKGSFKPLCWGKEPKQLPGLENVEAFYPNITKVYQVRDACTINRWKKPRHRKKPGEGGHDDLVLEGEDEEEGENVVETEESDKRKTYSSVGVHESSRLNHACGRRRDSRQVPLLIAISLFLVWR